MERVFLVRSVTCTDDPDDPFKSTWELKTDNYEDAKRRWETAALTDARPSVELYAGVINKWGILDDVTRLAYRWSLTDGTEDVEWEHDPADYID
jgi:hypothetical protein